MMNKIYNEDCLETMSRMPDNFLDLIVTSPPYDGIRDFEGFKEFDFENIAKSLFRVLKDGGCLVWIMGDQTKDFDESCTSFKHALYFKEIGFKLHDTMIYRKIGMSFPEEVRYLPCFEYMFVFCKGRPKTINLIRDRKNEFTGTNQKSERQIDGTMVKDSYEAKPFGIRFNLWEYHIGYMKSYKDEYVSGHPAVFPEKLARDHIWSWSNEGDIVYDPFTGSGTTCKMAISLKRNFIGSEISEKYYKIAQRRISQVDINLL